MPQDQEMEELLRQIRRTVSGEPEQPGAPRNFANNYGRGTQPPKKTGGAIPAYNPDYEAFRKRNTSPQEPENAPEEDWRPEDWEPEEDRQLDEDWDDDEGWDDEDWETEDGYEDEDEEAYTHEAYEPEEPPVTRGFSGKEKKKKTKKKRGCGCLTGLLVLAVLLGGLILGLSFWIRAPKTDTPMAGRKSGAATILLCGTDLEGTRTDTMMLLYVCPREKALSLVSLPRDTLTYTTAGNYAKLNSAFGRNNGHEDPVEGMENLMLYVEDIIGYKPDGYMLINLDGFVDVVDAMGGVEFHVPQDMYYSDPTQNLYIDLREGLQTLGGYEAMCLVRFRKGYANQDLGRVDVQKEFLSACMDQWMRIKNVGKLPELLELLEVHGTTDLSAGNLLWLAQAALRSGLSNLERATLPGYADMIGGGSYYILYPGEVAELVNNLCNPYDKLFTGEDLNIAP